MIVNSNCTPPDILVCYRIKKNGSNHPNANNVTNLNSNVLANGLNNQTTNALSFDPQTQSNAIRQPKFGAGGLSLKQSKSRELRAGIMYTGCDCEKSNGLQDDCLRSECRGSPQCLTKPNPTCGPSEFSNGKHLELKRLEMERHMAQFRNAKKMAELSQYREDDGSGEEVRNGSVANKFNAFNNKTGGGVNGRNGDKGNFSSGNQDGIEEYCCYAAIALGGAVMCNGLEVGVQQKEE